MAFCRIAFDPRQNGVDDIRGKIMITCRNEALGSGDQEFTVGKTFGRCSQSADVAAGTGLSKSKTSKQFSLCKLEKIFSLLVFITEFE